MKHILNWLLPVFLIACLALEAAVYVVNPFHVSASQLPLRLFGLQLFKASDATMAPGVTEGQYVLVNAWPYRHGKPALGDVVALSYPAGSDEIVLRRIAALPGAIVELKDDVTIIDGKFDAAETHGMQPDLPSSRSSNRRWGPLRADCYFVLGDNRDSSQDSRQWGCVDGPSIMGRKW